MSFPNKPFQNNQAVEYFRIPVILFIFFSPLISITQVLSSEQKIVASNATEKDQFGFSVDVLNDMAAIGAPANGDISWLAGATYVYQKVDGVWTEVVNLKGEDTIEKDYFGISVALSKKYLVVGAQGDDDNGSKSGSVYVFKMNNGVWSQETKLIASDGGPQEFFGFSLSIDRNQVISGAYFDGDNGTESGSVYIFEEVNNLWSQTAKLKPSDGEAFARFGVDVDISGNFIIVGANLDDSKGTDSGSAYIFEKINGNWVEKAKLVPVDLAPDDRFGGAVAIDGNRAIVSNRLDDVFGLNSGSVYIFERLNGNWIQKAKLVPVDGMDNARFGTSVDIDGKYAICGAMFDDENGTDSGSAYIFERKNGKWTQKLKLTASDGDIKDRFGISVSIYNCECLIGAYLNDDAGLNSGSSYYYTIEKQKKCCLNRCKLKGQDLLDGCKILQEPQRSQCRKEAKKVYQKCKSDCKKGIY